MTRKLIIIFLLASIFTSCNKDKGVKCESLAEALATNNQEAARDFFENWVGKLSDETYNQFNLLQLVVEINADCDMNAGIHCFDCITTFPAQSEISLDFQYNGNSYTRYADFSRSAENKIIYIDFHE